jgi:hypothetical protein
VRAIREIGEDTMKSAAASKAKKPTKAISSHQYREEIAATVDRIEAIKPLSAKAAKAISMFVEWLEDESGYDEQVWPELKKSLNRERRRVGARRLFRD